MQFIDRKFELETLDKRYKSKNAEFFVIYGRRRIGKTELIKEFSKNKEHFYFLAKEQNIKLEIERFREKFAEKFNIRIEKTLDLEKIFAEILAKFDTTKKLIIIIDEFPYWVSKHKPILSEFQYLWDELLSKHNVFLILSGSSVSIIENEILAHKSPLHGRRTGQLKIGEIPLEYIFEFLPKYSFEDVIKTYGCIGAIPFYLKEFNTEKNVFENINNTFLNKSNILYEEAESLLREELREVNTYFNIISAISEGSTKLSEISSRSKVDITNINKYISTLIRLGIIKKEYCITQTPKSKNFLYKVDDRYIQFWLKYVFPYMEEIEENSQLIINLIKSQYDSYLGFVFEDICKKILAKKSQARIGRWWYKDKEIDIVGLNENAKEILIAECKWKENVDAVKILNGLKEKSQYVEWYNDNRKETFAIFAKSFKSKKVDGVKLYDLKDLEQIFTS